jgi:hypothetical protein
MWAEDCNINRNKIAEESLNTAKLHQKYLTLLLQIKTKMLKTEMDFNTLKLDKYRYFRGEMTKEELAERGWVQYQGLKPLKSDMEFVLEHDTEVGKMNIKIQYMRNMVYQLESILNSIKGRDWAIRNHIEWQKFQAGG